MFSFYFEVLYQRQIELIVESLYGTYFHQTKSSLKLGSSRQAKYGS